MQSEDGVFQRLWRDYKGLGIGGVIILLFGQLLLNNFFNWVNTLLVPVSDWLKTMFSELNIPPMILFGWVLTLLGFGIIIALIIKVQYDIKKNVLKVIAGKHFVNQTIELDGKRFVDCTFENCTLLWKGGAYKAEDILIIGRPNIAFQNGIVIDTLRLLRTLGFLKDDFSNSLSIFKNEDYDNGVSILRNPQANQAPNKKRKSKRGRK